VLRATANPSDESDEDPCPTGMLILLSHLNSSSGNSFVADFPSPFAKKKQSKSEIAFRVAETCNSFTSNS